MTRSRTARYSRSYGVRLFSHASGADLSGLFGATGVTVYSDRPRVGLRPDDARGVVLDYFIARGHTNDFLLDLRIVVTAE